jgi:DNA-directed RNA polymerase III subunit RPC1
LRKPGIDALQKNSIFKKIVEKCKKCHVCPRCGAFNGSVKKLSNVHTLKLIHERYKDKRADHDRAVFFQKLGHAVQCLPELSQHLSKAQEDLSPIFVLELFKRITDEDSELLWMNPVFGRPEHLLLSSILVPPVPIRPSVAMDNGAGSNEDDLTVKMQEILGVNTALAGAFNQGATVKMMVTDWNFLQVQVAQYINGEMPGLPKPIGEKQPIRGLCQRLKGKSGRFRGNLSGKRVDFSARTVISPDPNLRIDQVGVPVRVAMTMTYPDRVSRYNIEAMRRLVRNGPDKHPGANYIRSGPITKALMYGNRDEAASNLAIGDIVERHMLDGDVVLFNRQPSLHKLSIMAHKAKVLPWRTFRFNECCCNPYNADFDGDEMNMHLPQTEEARIEVLRFHLFCLFANLPLPRVPSRCAIDERRIPPPS